MFGKFGDPPKTIKEKELFRTMLLSKYGSTTPIPENVLEAQKEMFRAFAARSESEELASLLAQDSNAILSSHSSDLKWDFLLVEFLYCIYSYYSPPVPLSCALERFLLRAVSIFKLRNHGELPLGGHLPDMTSSSDAYIALQQVHRHYLSLYCTIFFPWSSVIDTS